MESTVRRAQRYLLKLLRAVEQGKEVIIRRACDGVAFKIVPKELRTLKPDPRWKGKIAYKDEDILASEWPEGK